MEISTLIQEFNYQTTRVSKELLADALDLYEAALDMVVKNPPKDQNSRIPGMEEFNLCHGIVETYYKQNPGFDYNELRGGFTPEQTNTLSNIQGDIEREKRNRENGGLGRYKYRG